jgi:hypothetical protein
MRKRNRCLLIAFLCYVNLMPHKNYLFLISRLSLFKLNTIINFYFNQSLVFRMVEAEEEYLEQLHLMVSCFLRPFKMAASSQKPPCTHDEVNSIFLNSETVMFLHQIFLKGLTARMECWPTLVLGIDKRQPECVLKY